MVILVIIHWNPNVPAFFLKKKKKLDFVFLNFDGVSLGSNKNF